MKYPSVFFSKYTKKWESNLGFDIYMYCQQNLSSSYWFTTPMADARPWLQCRVLGEEYFLSVKQYSRSREICKPFGDNFTFDQAFFNFFGCVLFTTVSDRKYSPRFCVRAPSHSAPCLSVFPPCFRLFCFPKLCLSVCLGIWYLLVLSTSFIIILLIDGSTFTAASWSQGSVFSLKSLAVFHV